VVEPVLGPSGSGVFQTEDDVTFVNAVVSGPTLTGIAMTIIFLISFPCCHEGYRETILDWWRKCCFCCDKKSQTSTFYIFWLTHHLFLVFLVLLCIHGAWEWLRHASAYQYVLPGLCCYFLEKIARGSYFSLSADDTTWGQYFKEMFFPQPREVVKVVQHNKGKSGQTLQLAIQRPESMRYLPGQYIFVNIPAVSKWEWHPFTLTSAPHEPFLQVHMASVGDWTKAAFSLFKGNYRKSNLRASNDHGDHQRRSTRIKAPREAPEADMELGNTNSQVMRNAEMAMSHFVESTGQSKAQRLSSRLSEAAVCEEELGRSDSEKMHRGNSTAALVPGDLPTDSSSALPKGSGSGSPQYSENAIKGSGSGSPQYSENAIPGIKVYVDGPFGAPAQDFHKYEVAVLIGAGIGVTPFAAVLKNIQHMHSCFRYNNAPLSYIQEITEGLFNFPTNMKLKKVYFHWTTRNQSSLKWFKEMMTQLLEEDEEGILEMHNYLTTASMGKSHAEEMFMNAAQHHKEKTGLDLVSGLTAKRVETHFSRPDWDKVFQDLKAAHPNVDKIGVFYCGPKVVRGLLKDACNKWSDFSREGVRFKLHAENF